MRSRSCGRTRRGALVGTLAAWIALVLLVSASGASAEGNEAESGRGELAVSTREGWGMDALADASHLDHRAQISPACQLHHEALELLAGLRPAPYTTPTSRRSSPSSGASIRHHLDRDRPRDAFSEDSLGPLSNFLRMGSRILTALFRTVFVEPFPLVEALVGGVGRALDSVLQSVADVLLGVGGLRRLGLRREGAAAGQNAAQRVKDLLELATEAGQGSLNGTCDAAWVTRGMVALLPPSGLARDLPLAHRALLRATEVTADPIAQFVLGFMHAAGLGPAERDQAKALLYYTFAALQGLTEAQMALGYRYWSGIGVKEDCMEALGWYEAAAERSYAHFLAGPPGGRTLPLTPTKQSDLAGGVYGPGASWASTGLNTGRAAIKAANAAASGEKYDDVLEYYQYHSDRGSHRDTVILGRIYYLGSVYSVTGGVGSGAEGVGWVGQDYVKARSYFLKVARAMWPTDPPLLHISAHGIGDGLPEDFDARTGARAMSKEAEAQLQVPAAVAAGLLGRIYLRGEGVEQDFLVARMWLKRASDLGDREAQNMLGLIYRDGLGVKALSPAWWSKFFQSAASHDHAEAKAQLGKYHYENNEPEPAVVYLNQAIQHGNPFEAFYYLAKIHAERAVMEDHAAHGGHRGTSGTCGVAVSFFKVVAERGNWQHDVVGDGERSWRNGDHSNALLQWWMAAEMGYEVALNNVAFVLDQSSQATPPKGSAVPHGASSGLVNDTRYMALTHWSRSASQQNVDALVKVGDYYYDGIGVGPHESRFEKAAAWYQSAADTQASAIAFWNLGWMYENGLGVAQDWHLAKRYYDLSRDTSAESYLPVTLSLIKLHARSWWAGLTGRGASGNGPGGRLRLFGRGDDDADQPRGHRGRGRLDRGHDEQQQARGYAPDGQRDGEDWDGWDGDAADESEHIRAGAEGYDEQVGYNRRQQDVPRDGRRVDWENDDNFIEIEIDEELAETLAIGLLVVGLTGLFWVRGRWMRRAREEREAEEARRRGGGGAGVEVGQAVAADGEQATARPVPDVRIDNEERRQQDELRRLAVPIDFAPLPI